MSFLIAQFSAVTGCESLPKADDAEHDEQPGSAVILQRRLSIRLQGLSVWCRRTERDGIEGDGDGKDGRRRGQQGARVIVGSYSRRACSSIRLYVVSQLPRLTMLDDSKVTFLSWRAKSGSTTEEALGRVGMGKKSPPEYVSSPLTAPANITVFPDLDIHTKITDAERAEARRIFGGKRR